jgi:TIR domain
MPDTLSPVKVFCSYSYEDRRYLQKLKIHLSGLEREGLISTWHDCEIPAGTDRAKTIDSHLETASLILILISADFIASDYSYEIEMTHAMERHNAGKARVIPILLRSVAGWQNAPFGHLQVLPNDGKFVTQWDDQDEAFTNIAQGIREVLGDVQGFAVNTPRKQFSYELPAVTNLPPLKASWREEMIREGVAQDTIDTQEAINIFSKEIMQDNAHKRIFCLLGKENTGKSHFLKCILSLLANPIEDTSLNASWYRRDVKHALVSLNPKKGYSTVRDVLRQVCDHLGDPYFSAHWAVEQEWMSRLKADLRGPNALSSHEDYEARYLTKHFIKALSRFTDQRILLLFDQVDQAKSLERWLMNNLLVATFPLEHIRVVLAGRLLPEPHGSYQAYCLSHELRPIKHIDEYVTYCQQKNLRLSEEQIHALVHGFEYIPGTIAKAMERFTDPDW